MASRSTNATADRTSAPEALVISAQRLFAEQGIDRTSLREVAAAAGQRNVNAVQYHFGDRAGLVRAIYEYNSPILDALRAQRLADMRIGQHEATPRDLVTAFFMPLIDHVDADGRRSYAAFQLQALKTPGWRQAWRDIRDQVPVTRLIVDMILDLAPRAKRETMARHLVYASIVFLSMIGDIDDMAEAASPEEAAGIVEDTITLVTRMCGG